MRRGHQARAADAASQDVCACIASSFTQVLCQVLAADPMALAAGLQCFCTMWAAGGLAVRQVWYLLLPFFMRWLPQPKILPAAGQPGSGASLLSPWSGCRTPAAGSGARTLSPMRWPGLCRLTARPSHGQRAHQLLQAGPGRKSRSLTWQQHSHCLLVSPLPAGEPFVG